MDIQREVTKYRRLKQALYPAVIIVAVSVLSVAGWSFSARPPAVDADRVWVGTVERGELVRQVAAAGRLVAPDLRAVTNRNEGVVERVRVLPGDRVQANTILVEMSSPALKEDLSAARWEFAQAKAEEQLREVDAGNRYLDLVAEVAAADAEYTGVRLELEAQEELRERQVFSEIEVERTRLRAQQLLRRLEAERARLDRFSDSREAEADASQARLSRLGEQVQRLESRVANLSVVAGVAGVVQEVNVQEGERLGSGHVIARVVNTEKLMARVNVAERDAAQVMVGMPVSLEIGRIEETGAVARIDPTVRDRSVHVDVALEDAQLDRLRPDLSVTARIELERVADVLVLDRPAGLRDEFESLRLFRLIESGERARATNVKIGRVSTRQVEVLEGLSAGDRVILADMTEWREEPLLRIR